MRTTWLAEHYLPLVLLLLLPSSEVYSQSGTDRAPALADLVSIQVTHPALETAPEHATRIPLAVLNLERRKGEDADTMVEQQLVLEHTRLVYPQPDARLASPAWESIVLGSTWQRDPVIHNALQQPVAGYEFYETALQDVLKEIKQRHNIPFVPDLKALEDAGLGLDVPITASIPAGIQLRSALRLILSDLDLTYCNRTEVLIITTRQAAEETLVTVQYPIPFQDDSAAFIATIKNSVYPTTWDIQGGPGDIALLHPNVLAISQTDEVHESIADFVSETEDREFQFVAKMNASGSSPARLVTRAHVIRNEAIQQNLEQNLAAICNAALGDLGDPTARVSILGDAIVIQSASRPFHVYARQIIQSIIGVRITSTDVIRPSARPGNVKHKSGMGGSMRALMEENTEHF